MVRFTPRLLYPKGKSPWYPLDRGWVGPRAVPDAMVKRRRRRMRMRMRMMMIQFFRT